MLVSRFNNERDYSRFYFILLADQITVIGNKMSAQTSRLAIFVSQIKQRVKLGNSTGTANTIRGGHRPLEKRVYCERQVIYSTSYNKS